MKTRMRHLLWKVAFFAVSICVLCFYSWSDDPVEKALVCLKRWDIYVVPLQAGIPEVWVALQEGRRTLYSFPEVVVVTTELSLHAYKKNHAMHDYGKTVAQPNDLKNVWSCSNCHFSHAKKLEDALVCSKRQQADVLWEWQWGEAERNHWHPSG